MLLHNLNKRYSPQCIAIDRPSALDAVPEPNTPVAGVLSFVITTASKAKQEASEVSPPATRAENYWKQLKKLAY